MSEERMDILADILLQHLNGVLVNQTIVNNRNPTINDILSTGRNVISVITKGYIRRKSHLFWRDFIWRYRHTGVENPEGLFNDRSRKLAGFTKHYKDHVTRISGAVTPSNRMLSSSLWRYLKKTYFSWILESFKWSFPNLVRTSEQMSFEGQWDDLITMARLGVNTLVRIRLISTSLFGNPIVFVHFVVSRKCIFDCLTMISLRKFL